MNEKNVSEDDLVGKLRDRLMAAWITLFDLEPMLPQSKASILYAARKIIGELLPANDGAEAGR